MNNDDPNGLLAQPTDDPNSIPASDPAPDQDKLRRMFREAAEATDEQRRHAREDRDYFDGPHQIDRAMRAKLQKMRVPEVYHNKIKQSVSRVLGLMDSNETSPEAIARNADGENAADLVTEILRYQADHTELNSTLAYVSQDYFVEGIGAVKVEVDHKDNCDVQHLRYDEFYYDPHSIKADFSDASYLIHAYWTDIKAVRRMWPDVADQVSFTSFADNVGPEDAPVNAKYWIDTTGKRVMLVDCYYEDDATGSWKRAIYTHSAILEHGDSGYQNDQGDYISPILAISYHVMREGERIGMVRDLKPLQQTINGLEASFHRLAVSNRVKMTPNSDGDPSERDLARREAQRADGALPRGWDLAGNDPRMSAISAQLAALNAELDNAAPGNAQLAQAGANTSGRARQMLAQAGLADLSRAFGRFEVFGKSIYERMWWVARQYMTDRTMMMVTDNAGARQTLTINDPVIEQQMQPVMVPHIDPQTNQQIAHPVTGQPMVRQAIHPLTGQPLKQPVNVHVATNNHLAVMDMQITLKVVPLADTLRGEAKQQLMEWSAKSGISPLNPAFKMLIQISDIPDKQEILRLYAECVAEDQQQQAPAQAAQQQAAQTQQTISAQAAQAHAAREQAAAARDQTVALKHEQETKMMALDNAWKAMALQRGINPNDASI